MDTSIEYPKDARLHTDIILCFHQTCCTGHELDISDLFDQVAGKLADVHEKPLLHKILDELGEDGRKLFLNNLTAKWFKEKNQKRA